MSYSVGVHCHTCGELLNHGKDSLPYGLKPLFEELGCSLDGWDGSNALDLLPKLQGAINELRSDLDIGDYKRRHDADSPEWSRVDFALPFLEGLRDAICREPYARVRLT